MTLYVPARVKLTLLVVLLVGYWAALMLIPVPGTGAMGLAAIGARGSRTSGSMWLIDLRGH